jgi:hypothetical protein
MIGYKLDPKSLGKRSALNAHAAFDVAGAGNMIAMIGAPVLDPTCERLGLKYPCLDPIVKKRTTTCLIVTYKLPLPQMKLNGTYSDCYCL